MEYKILTGEELNEAFLEKIMEVDRECYAGEYVGELANLQARYRKNPKSFVYFLHNLGCNFHNLGGIG